MNLYIIGPITGIEDDNRSEFDRVKRALFEGEACEEAYTPFEIAEPSLMGDWNSCMRHSIAFMMVGDGCYVKAPDGIAMLDGWVASKGALIEHDVAVQLGVPCKPWREWL